MAEPDRPRNIVQSGEARLGNATGSTPLLAVAQNQPAESDTTSGITYPNNKREWLSSVYLDAEDPGRLTVDDFSKIKASTHSVDSYWQDVHIKWALEMIRRKHKGLNDVHIVSHYTCNMLYRVASFPGYLSDRRSPDDLDWKLNYAPMAETLRKSNFVILPVNNGYSDKTAGKPESQGSGTHWSFIVVDRRDPDNATAHYVDGMVQAVPRRNGSWRINEIDMNGEVAGKILCGFDSVLGLEKGKLVASTLKFVPHMFAANASSGNDRGPCGPHLYAFLDHILTNKTTLIDPGMQVTFNDAATSETRAIEFGFDSKVSRAKFAKALMGERRRKEAEQPRSYVDNITPPVLRSLMTVDGLINLVRNTANASTPVASDHKGNREDTGNKAPDDDDDDEDGYFGNDPKIPKSLLRDEIKSNSSTYQDIPKPLYRHRLAYDSLVEKQRRIEKSMSFKPPKKEDQKPKTVKEDSSADIYVGSACYRNVPRNDPAMFPLHEYPAKFPGSFRTMHFADMTPLGVTTWTNANSDVNAQIKTRDKKKVWIYSARSMLHFKFKKTFLLQSDAEFERVWSHDEQVFSPQELTVLKEKYKEEENKRIMYGIMRERVMRHYQGDETVDALLKMLRKYRVNELSSGTKRKRDGNDSSGSGDILENDDPDSSKGKGKRVRRSNDPPTSPDGHVDRSDTFLWGYRDASLRPSGTGGSIDNDSSTSLTIPRPEGLLSFRTMNPNELENYMTDGMRDDPRYKDVMLRGGNVEPNVISMRAMCFADVAEERFGDESDADCQNVWYNDSLVFTEVQRRTKRCTPRFIRKKMAQHYHPKDPIEEDKGDQEPEKDETEEELDKEEDHSRGDESNGLGSDEEEVDDFEGLFAAEHSTDRPANTPQAPPDFSITKGTKRELEASEDLLMKRRKLDHVDFLNMKERELAWWITNMPPTFRNEFPANGQIIEQDHIHKARIWLERMYGDGFEHLRKELPPSETTSEAEEELSETDVKIEKYALLSEAEKRKLKSWQFNSFSLRPNSAVGYQDLLHKVLLSDPVIDGRRVPIPDRRAELLRMRQEAGIPSAPAALAEPSVDPPKQPSDTSSHRRGGSRTASVAPLADIEHYIDSAQQQRGLRALQDAANRIQDAAADLIAGNLIVGLESSGIAPGARTASEAPDDSNSSASLDWLVESPEWPSSTEEEQSSSGDSDPGAANNQERRHGSADCEPESEDGPLKKAKTGTENDQPRRSPENRSTIGQGSADDQVVNKPTSSLPVNSSFDSQATVEDETIEIYIGRQLYSLDLSNSSLFLLFNDTRDGWPAGTTSLPDFAHLPAPTLLQWRRANPDLPFPTNTALKNFTRSLALLHMKFKRTFLHEPDASFSDVWIQDRAVFSVKLRAELRTILDPGIMNGEIRRHMMGAYEPEMLGRIEALPKPRLVNPKITVQRGTFEDPESFDPDVHPGEDKNGMIAEEEGVDETRLSPSAAKAVTRRGRFGLREAPRPSKKKGGN